MNRTAAEELAAEAQSVAEQFGRASDWEKIADVAESYAEKVAGEVLLFAADHRLEISHGRENGEDYWRVFCTCNWLSPKQSYDGPPGPIERLKAARTVGVAHQIEAWKHAR